MIVIDSIHWFISEIIFILFGILNNEEWKEREREIKSWHDRMTCSNLVLFSFLSLFLSFPSLFIYFRLILLIIIILNFTYIRRKIKYKKDATKIKTKQNKRKWLVLRESEIKIKHIPQAQIRTSFYFILNSSVR